MKKIAIAVLVAVVLVFGPISYADEGMWLLNSLPFKQLKDKYNFEPDSRWVEHIQKSSARLPNCSTSFVSSDGLLMTNWHCSEDTVKALSTPNNNYYENGFYARTFREELKTNLNVRVLISMTDVTQRVNDAVADDKTGDSARARQKVITEIQVAEIQRNSPAVSNIHLTCEIVVLYQGGQYHNYCYKVYDDIRLVFMPEQRVGFLGGDADNFEYPRYTLDVSFLRAYENGKPASTPHHYKWSRYGSQEGELLFVAGHPGRTARLLTSAALKTERDVRVPFLLDLFRRRELTTQQFILRGSEQRRVAESDLFSWQNSRKLYAGKIKGLQDPALMRAKESFERKVISDADTVSRLEFVEGMLLIKDAQDTIRDIYPEWALLVRKLALDSEIFSGGVPNNLEYEEHKLTDSLTHLVEILGADSRTVSEMMKQFGSGPVAIAHNLIYNSAEKEKFLSFIKSQSDHYEQQMKDALEKERQGYAKIDKVLFKMYGMDRYPDATFTLRLSFGTITGDRQHGVLPFTTIGGAFRHSAKFGNSGDYKLPSKWWMWKNAVNERTRLNFISNLDITGGNSGSPVFNKNLEIVGLVFDSNIEGLVSDYDYNYSARSRAVAVHSAGILEILKKIYRADRLVRELVR